MFLQGWKGSRVTGGVSEGEAGSQGEIDRIRQEEGLARVPSGKACTTCVVVIGNISGGKREGEGG